MRTYEDVVTISGQHWRLLNPVVSVPLPPLHWPFAPGSSRVSSLQSAVCHRLPKVRSSILWSGLCLHGRPDAENELETLTADIQQTSATLESLQRQQTEHARGFARQQKMTERYLAKRQMLSARKDECSRNIRDLGVLPEEAFEKYTGDKVKVDKVCGRP